MSEQDDIPTAVLDALRAICLPLPEASEEEAWAGVRWVVRRRNFAHVVVVDHGWPPAYARACGSDGPITLLTFRTPTPEPYRDGLAGPGFFYPRWFADLAGMALDDAVDWDEVAELVTESYCHLAPKHLAALVERPEG